MSDPVHNVRCRARHLGVWAISPDYLASALVEIRSGAWRPRAESGAEDAPRREPEPLYRVTASGVAVVSIAGAMMKGWSKYAECDTLRVREALRSAKGDDNVRAILLVIDSPGGSVAGTQELADDVAAARQFKPVHAFAEDCCASAAYWVASQAGRLTMNAMCLMGSIGVLSVVYDSSKAAEMEGVKVHVISTGPLKGAGTPGAPVTEDALAEHQQIVDAAGRHFFDAVSRGRAALAGDALKAVSTGGVWMGKDAVGLGLVDAVETMQQAHDALVAEADRADAARRGVEARRIAAGTLTRKR